MRSELVEPVAERAVELRVVRRAELLRLAVDRVRGGDVQRVEVLLRQVVTRALELCPQRMVLGIRDRRAEHPVGDLLAADVRLDRRFHLGELLRLDPRQLAEVSLAREPPQLAHARAAVDSHPDPVRLLELGQVGVALVDRLQVVRVLVPGEVEVRLLVELGDEPVGLRPVGVELAVTGRGARHGRVG